MIAELFLWLTLAATQHGLHQQTVIAVVGAPGTAEYQKSFTDWTAQWRDAASTGEARFYLIGEAADEDPREALRACVTAEGQLNSDTLWLVLIGHGTFDGQEAKFNLRGPDVSAEELAEWLEPCRRQLVIVNCASSSAPFLSQLAAPERIVITATKSGFQYNFARFGAYLASAIADPAADLDKDEQVSVLEAFLLAAARVQEFYETDGRLTTENALLDDTGDGKGTPADWFRGVRVQRQASDGTEPDGLRANQLALVRSSAERLLTPEMRKERDQLEAEIELLRKQKAELAEDEYYNRLEPIFVRLANLYATAESRDQ